MRKKLVPSTVGAGSGQEGSTVWNVDIRKQESGFECWVADARGNTLARRPLKSVAVSSIVEVLEGAIRDLGLPSRIRTDCGTVFTGQGYYACIYNHSINSRDAPQLSVARITT
jgi:hypothetical protein